ncbi:host-nuclease inhibitor Gam family protein [Cellulosilyticum ruminicola]|uniref:host-nuclease inhibitor Gam family protein n=1 Tax=Cellulosilyticum ruminicola TaxID=425254 RepID=UPI0006D0303C|nr:host-nuclease inhibitor Gam family protein [Cellulosilyticum ruminicola]
MSRKAVLDIDQRALEVKVEMDNLVEDIMELDAKIIELEAMFKMQVERLKDKFEEKQFYFKAQKEEKERYLRELFEQVPQSETKTQRKVQLINGDVVVKKSKMDFEKDATKLLEWAQKNNREELINKKEVLSFKWADFKKNLVIEDENIIDTQTGEMLVIDGLDVVTKSEELEIKY